MIIESWSFDLSFPTDFCHSDILYGFLLQQFVHRVRDPYLRPLRHAEPTFHAEYYLCKNIYHYYTSVCRHLQAFPVKYAYKSKAEG